MAKEVSITYHFVKVPCSSITVNPDRKWMARTRSEVQGGLAEPDLCALQESIERLNVLDPLIVLFTDDPMMEPVSAEKIQERLEVNGAEVEIVIGYRRLKALQGHLSEAKDPHRKVEVQVVLKSELDRDNGGHGELALTKIVASSNAFFKGYSPDDKLRLTKNLYDLIKQRDGSCSHTAILNLMGEQSRVAGMQLAGYKASLRRFNIVKNPELYAAVMGIDPSDPDRKRVHDKFKIIDRQMAELVAKEIGNDSEKVGTFLSAVREEFNSGRIKEKQGVPAFRWRGYKTKLYNEWIYNIRLHGNAKGKVQQTFKPYTYKVKCAKNQVSIPAVRINISSTHDNEVAKFVEVTYKVCQLADKLKGLLRRLKLKPGQSPASAPEPLEVSPIPYGREYKDFIRRFNAENFAHPYRIAKAYGLLDETEWAKSYEDLIKMLEEKKEEETEEKQGQEMEDLRDLELTTFRAMVAEEVAKLSCDERFRDNSRYEERDNLERDMENRLRFLRSTPEKIAMLVEGFKKMKEKLILAGTAQESDFDFLENFSWATMPGFFNEVADDQAEDAAVKDGEEEGASDSEEEPSSSEETTASDTTAAETTGNEFDAILAGSEPLNPETPQAEAPPA